MNGIITGVFTTATTLRLTLEQNPYLWGGWFIIVSPRKYAVSTTDTSGAVHSSNNNIPSESFSRNVTNLRPEIPYYITSFLGTSVSSYDTTNLIRTLYRPQVPMISRPGDMTIGPDGNLRVINQKTIRKIIPHYDYYVISGKRLIFPEDYEEVQVHE